MPQPAPYLLRRIVEKIAPQIWFASTLFRFDQSYFRKDFSAIPKNKAVVARADGE
jgi:hypothetical protein